jgi:diaminohydroxyphosphoribosylaminopyrimidine deaminase/5-amino-6-(5-phosphoribosylamino)uracil reductase
LHHVQKNLILIFTFRYLSFFLSFANMIEGVDSTYMRRALQLAERGGGSVAPNPMVGCVIVRGGEVIGEGYHMVYGGPHAEVNAINSVENQGLLKEATLYVTLEPCAHFGKTPPCSNLIIEKGIPRVVVGCRDPFKEVNGKGVELLRAAGVEVVTDVLFDECREINKRFFTFHEKNRPYVMLKWAQSADGFMDIDRREGNRGSFMISHPDTQVLVHTWRAEEAAILIGKNTLLNDNPSLTVRRVDGKNPLRIVLTSQPIDLQDFKLGSDEAPTLVLTNETESESKNWRFAACTNVRDVAMVLSRLHQENVLSILVEGGATVLKSFIDSGIWDEARVIISNRTLGSGLSAPAMECSLTKEDRSTSDTIRLYYNKS